jgi:hypothetical protein
MPETTISTTLTESVNIVLANIGESPVNSITGAVPVQVSLALNTIEEVSADVQSKGWWFNQNSSYDANGVATGTYAVTNDITIRPSDVSNDWHDGIPEEARRYITIRASRIAQTRLVGSEELQKFSYNEELVSLAILQQAHVRNSNGVLDFNEFPAELKGLGVDEVMFLQGNVEEKIGTLRLGGELANIAKTKAEAALIADQERLVDQQVATEVQETSKRAAEKDLVDAQKSQVQTETVLRSQQALTELEETSKRAAEKALIDAQELKTDAEKLLVDEQAGLITNQAATELKKALDVAADTTIKGKQGALIDKQVLTEVQNALKVVAETSLLNDQEALVVNQAATELKKALDIAADTTLKGKQGSLIDNQAATELKRALDLVADTTLKGKQGSLVDAQALDVAADTTLKGKQGSALDADTALKTSQKAELDAKTAIDVAAEKAFYDGVVAGTQDTYRDYAAEMRMMGIQESTFQQTPAYKKVELLKDAQKLRATAGSSVLASGEIGVVNKILRLIGEPTTTSVSSNALNMATLQLMRDVDRELQGRGWWFNTEKDVEITPVNGTIVLDGAMLSAEANDYDTRLDVNSDGAFILYDLNKKSSTSWTSPVKVTAIYKRSLPVVPDKYEEYLVVRTAILLTELYPQSGIDIQRLPKMEQELRAYFKDREFDDANYSVFDNYDAASRMGVNRNYSIL